MENSEPQSGFDESDSDMLESLTQRINERDSDLDSISAISAISRAIHQGLPASEIIEMHGGLDEVERRIGTKLAQELQDQADKEE